MQTRKTRKLKCVVTGKTLLATREYYDRKVELAGSEDFLHDTYVCREAKDLLIKGYTVEKIRELLNVCDDTLTSVSQEVIEHVLSSKSNTYRKVNIFNTSNNLLNFRTDPKVTELINNLKNESNTDSNT